MSHIVPRYVYRHSQGVAAITPKIDSIDNERRISVYVGAQWQHTKCLMLAVCTNTYSLATLGRTNTSPLEIDPLSDVPQGRLVLST